MTDERNIRKREEKCNLVYAIAYFETWDGWGRVDTGMHHIAWRNMDVQCPSEAASEAPCCR